MAKLTIPEDDRVVELVKMLLQGDPPGKVAQKLGMNQKRPHTLIQQIYDEGRLHYVSPLQHQLEDAGLGLESVDVVVPSTLKAVADRVASKIINVLRQIRARGDRIARVGFSGGRTMWLIAQELKRLLEKPSDSLPKEIMFYGLAAGFDDNLQANPEAPIAYLMDCTQITAHTCALNRQKLRSKDERDRVLSELESIGQARRTIIDNPGHLHLVVTSVAAADDPHSHLANHYNTEYSAAAADLHRSGWIGDMLWLPIGGQGPIRLKDQFPRATTLIELTELPALVSGGTKVLVAAGPCAGGVCPPGSKAAVLNVMLHLRDRYITDLVIDSRMAASLIDKHRAETRGVHT